MMSNLASVNRSAVSSGLARRVHTTTRNNSVEA
jgi:hypothetical protein